MGVNKRMSNYWRERTIHIRKKRYTHDVDKYCDVVAFIMQELSEKLGIDFGIADKILRYLQSYHLIKERKSPLTYAATLLWLASEVEGGRVSQRAVSKAAGVGSGTVQQSKSVLLRNREFNLFLCALR